MDKSTLNNINNKEIKNVAECKEAQANEIAALQAIFMDDFEEVNDAEFKINVTPYPSQEKNNYSSVTLVVAYTSHYPSTSAIVHLEKCQGLTEKQFNELAHLVAQENELPTGLEKIFDLTQIVCEYLQIHNKEPLSLHDEMERRRVIKTSEPSDFEDVFVSPYDDDTEAEEDNAVGLTSIFDGDQGDLNLSEELSNPPQIEWSRQHLIGTGPNGEVYAGINTLTLHPIVIKEIIYESSSSSGNEAFSTQCGLIAREVEGMTHLRHPNLVRYIACEYEDNALRILQEPVAYANVKEACYPASPILSSTASRIPSHPLSLSLSILDEGTIRKYTRQILHALLYLHTHHVAHRNLKCTNILLESRGGSGGDGRILLSDYGGYHRKLYDYLSDVRGRKNAHYYMGHHSVHQGGGGITSHVLARKDDVYHLALCIISMAGGSTGTMEEEEGGDGEGIIIPEHLSRAAKEFLHACLKRDPQERPEVASLLKHPFATQPYTPSHPLSLSQPFSQSTHLGLTSHAILPIPGVDSHPSTSASSASVSTTDSQSHAPVIGNITSSDTSTSTNPPMTRREIAKKNKSANALASAFAAARSDDDESTVSSESTTSTRENTRLPSRYRQDFEELEVIGRGGFGIVVKARNKLDGRYYAIKKIKIDGTNQALTTKMLREVTTLSRLHHQHVVRYYQAWIERADFTSMAVGDGDDSDEDDDDEDDEDDEDDDEDIEDLSGSLATEESEDWFESSGPPSTSTGMVMASSPDRIGGETETEDDDEADSAMRRIRNARGGSSRRMLGGVRVLGKPKKFGNKDPQYLYIQMEYCPKKTLRNVIDESKTEPEDNWYLFRQIIEGLSHIHQQGIIHRDLKPANIFIDDDDSIKIGDFGLATTGGVSTQRPIPTSTPSIPIPTSPIPTPSFMAHKEDSWAGLEADMSKGRKGTRDRSMTGGVGTYFYCCPELLHRGTKHYGVKVDMYSAGIIFFEMWQPFSTEMERASTLNALRSRLEFPVGFEAAHPQEAEVIRMLLQHDPDNRPDTLGLLKSDLLPTRMEEEILKEAIKTIANPNQGPIFSLLLDRLFSLPPDDHVLQTYHYSSAPFSTAHAAIRDSVFSRLRHIFRLHGALGVDTPLLFPKTSKVSAENGQNTAQLLDAGGVLVGLPYDLTFPWARYVAHHRLTSAKRYALGKVYRKSLPGSAPRELWECDFDIVGPPQYRVTHECEVIVTMCQILDEYSNELGPYTIGINHFQLLTAMLEACEVPRVQHATVCGLLSQKYRTSWAEVASVIRTEVSARCANMMEPFFSEVYPPGSINTQLDRLAKLLSKFRNAQLAISDLRTLARHLAAVNVLPKAFIDLSLVYHPGYYDGVLYQAILQKGKGGKMGEVVMAGGRYDGLVKIFAQQQQQQDGINDGGNEISNVGAVGVNIAVEKIVSGVLAFESRKGGKHSHPQQQHYQQDLDVVVCSIGSALTEEKMSVVAVLWAAHVRADYIPFESTSVEELASVCKDRKIPWIITLKDRSYNMRGVVRLRNVETRAEMDLSRKEVAAVILQRGSIGTTTKLGGSAGSTGSGVGVNSEDMPPTSIISSFSSSATAGGGGSSHALPIVFSNVEIVVLHDETRGRANRKIIIQAQQDMSRVLRALSPNTIAKVACVDLPSQICREVVANFDNPNPPTPAAKIERVIAQRINSLKNLLAKWKSLPLVFIYSYRDNKHVALAMM